MCAVSGAKFLTENGWVDLRNSVDSDVPFRLFRDEGRTFLQVSLTKQNPLLRTNFKHFFFYFSGLANKNCETGCLGV